MTTKVVSKRGDGAVTHGACAAKHRRDPLTAPLGAALTFRSLTEAIAPKGAAGEKPPVPKHGASHPARQASLASRPHLRRLHMRDKMIVIGMRTSIGSEIMGIKKLIEEVGGAIAAEQAAEAADPNAGILVKGAAAVAGFAGAGKLSDALQAHTDAKQDAAQDAADANDAPPEPK